MQQCRAGASGAPPCAVRPGAHTRSLLRSCGLKRSSYSFLFEKSASHLRTRPTCSETGFRLGPCSSDPSSGALTSIVVHRDHHRGRLCVVGATGLHSIHIQARSEPWQEHRRVSRPRKIFLINNTTNLFGEKNKSDLQLLFI